MVIPSPAVADAHPADYCVTLTLICLEFLLILGIARDTSDRYRRGESPGWEPEPAVHLETPASRTSIQGPWDQLPWHKD